MTGYPEPNYTETPNALFDIDMRDMTEAELKVTLAIIRKVIGWHKTEPEEVSYSQLQEMTGLSRQGVTSGIKAALKRGRIRRMKKRGPRGVSLFTINFAQKSTQQTSTSLQNRPELVNEVDTQKKALKEKETKKDSTDTPTAVGAEHEKKRKSTPKTLDNIDPLQAVVAYRAFGVKPGQVITGRTMTRVNTIIKELRERYTNGHGVEPTELKAAFIWHANGRGDNTPLSAPQDAVKVGAMVEAYRTIHGHDDRPTLSSPDPNCPICEGRGWHNVKEPGGGSHSVTCECRTALAVAS